MKPRDLFGVIVRAFGLFSSLIGFYLVCSTALSMIETWGGYAYGYLFGLGYAFVFLLMGYVLMRGADRIVRLLYPRDDQ